MNIQAVNTIQTFIAKELPQKTCRRRLVTGDGAAVRNSLASVRFLQSSRLLFEFEIEADSRELIIGVVIRNAPQSAAALHRSRAVAL